jgi:hypothetical protein
MLFAAVALSCIAVSSAMRPTKVSQTLARVPILEASFEILDYDIQFECPVVVSTSCSSKHVLEDSFRRIPSSDLITPISSEKDNTKGGLALNGWVTVGRHISFPIVISRTDCPEAIATLCVGPTSEFVSEHRQFGMSRRGLVPVDPDETGEILYTPAFPSKNGWSMHARSIYFGHKKLSHIEVAINTDQIAPIALSEDHFAFLFGSEVFPSPSADDARVQFYRKSSFEKKPLRIRIDSKMEMSFPNFIRDDGLWFEIIRNPKDPRYHQIGLGYDLLSGFDIRFDQVHMRIGFKVSV